MSRSAIPSKRPANDAQEAAWVADEDRFVLQQAKKKAVIRVKGGRAQPIDWLAATLTVIDPDRNPLDDEVETEDLELVEPESVFEGLSDAQLAELEKGVDTYFALEKSRSNVEYWTTMKTICADRRQQRQSRSTNQASARGVTSVAGDLDKLLGPKTLEELEKLERQITAKLASNEPIDTDYWEHLLGSLRTYKARAKLRKVSLAIVGSRMEGLRKQQAEGAAALKTTLDKGLRERQASGADAEGRDGAERAGSEADGRHPSDPEPLLRVRPEDKSLESMTEKEFAEKLAHDRQKVLKQGYIPTRHTALQSLSGEPSAKRLHTSTTTDEQPQSTTLTAFDREVARGLRDNEEIFTAEVSLLTKNLSTWSHQHRPRKPRYFARVVTGYEWNKYNQTHYDHDNPPPKVVQGYKFNIFYPDLLPDSQGVARAPTYKLERSDGRRKGETWAKAGEEDTCVIRFVAGAPYEDLGFSVVDREWDYSAKRERGFRSRFEKGVLMLHFQFKKIYYRK